MIEFYFAMMALGCHRGGLELNQPSTFAFNLHFYPLPLNKKSFKNVIKRRINKNMFILVIFGFIDAFGKYFDSLSVWNDSNNYQCEILQWQIETKHLLHVIFMKFHYDLRPWFVSISTRNNRIRGTNCQRNI